MILYIDEIFIQHQGKKNKADLNEDKKDDESLLKTLVKFHINVFIKMFCSGRNTDFSKTSDGRYWQHRTHSLSCLSSQIPECLEGTQNLHSASTRFVEICSQRCLIDPSGTQKLWLQDSCPDSRTELSFSLPVPSLLRLNAALKHETNCRHYIYSIFVLKENNQEPVLSKH